MKTRIIVAVAVVAVVVVAAGVAAVLTFTSRGEPEDSLSPYSVSYTHLTLPTIYSV